MVRTPCCDKMGLKKGPWTPGEDQVLISYIQQYGHGNWRDLPKQAGLLRCGKSCRLRWVNYLRPDIKRGKFSKEEEETIINLHRILGNRWSAIAARLPGRTDNEIKNFWHTHLKKRVKKDPDIPATSITSPIEITWHSSIRDMNAFSSLQEASTFFTPSSSAAAVLMMQPLRRDHKLEESTPPSCIDKTVHLLADVSPARKYPSTTADHAGGNHSSKSIRDKMDFWYNLWIKTGEQAPQLHEDDLQKTA